MLELTINEVTQVGNLMEATKRLDALIDHYSESNPGPAYIKCEHLPSLDSAVQFERSIMITALQSQRDRYVASLSKFGVKYVTNKQAS